MKDLTEVGYIQKTHGVKGGVTLQLTEPLDSTGIKTLFIGKEIPEPYFLVELSGSGTKIHVRLEDITTLEQAKALVGSKVLVQGLAPAEPGLNQCLDYEVVDVQRGPIGKIVQTTSGLNPLLVIDYHGEEVLIPWNGPFITGIDPEGHLLEVDLPEDYPGLDTSATEPGEEEE